MLQDKTGFIWFGTLNGLNRYDGIKVKTIIPDTKNPNSLSSGKIKELYEDSHGHIWVKTYSDVFHCYDPYSESFLPLFKNKEDFNIKHNFYYEDKERNIWLGSSYNGCMKINFSEDEITTTYFRENDPAFPLPSNTINDIYQDSKKNTWILTASGLMRLNTSGKLISEIKSTGNEVFVDIHEINQMLFLIGTTGKIFRFNLKTNRFESGSLNTGLNDIVSSSSLSKNFILLATSNNGIFLLNTLNSNITPDVQLFGQTIRGAISFSNDRAGGIWISNSSGNVWRINYRLQTNSLNLIPPGILQLIDFERYQFVADNHRNIWIITYGNGLFSFNLTSGKLTQYRYNKTSDHLTSNYLLALLHDRQGNIWVGTENGGVDKLSFTNRNVKNIYPDLQNLIKNGNVIRSVLEDKKGNIWVGSKAGNVYLYSSDLNQRSTVLENNYNVYAMHEDKNGNIYLGTRRNGLYELEGGNKNRMKVFRQTENTESLSDNNIFSITTDRKDRLWVATFGGGVNVRIKQNGRDIFRKFFYDDEYYRYTRHLCLDSRGKMWVGTSNGVLRFYPDSLLINKKAFEYFKFDNMDESSLTNPEVRYIFEDSKNNIWMATSGGGLNLFTGISKEGKATFKSYRNQLGIASDNIMAMLEDNEGNLWVSTETGIHKFNQQSGIFQYYKFSNDFSANIYSETTAIKSRDGRLIWGSLNGLISFQPKEIIRNNKAGNKAFITGISIFTDDATVGKKKAPLKVSSTFADKVVLRYSDQVFHIEFSTLSFNDPKSNQFRYMLENYEKRWNNTSGDNNVATYRNVPSGKYTFKVKSINSDGVWEDSYTSIEVIIKPPFWRSPLAWLIYIIIIIILVYLGIRIAWNFYRLDNAVKVERQLTDYKLRFFTNISHEFRTPLTLIKGNIDTIMELKPKLSESLVKVIDDIDKNTSHLMRLIEQLLEFRKLQNNKQKLNLQRVEAINFLKEIYKSFENVAEKTNISYNFYVTESSIPIFFDKNKVDKIVFNLLSNAFKFTPRGGKIDMIIEADHDKHVLKISVSDNGIGIPKEKQNLLFSRFMQINFSQQGTGIGLHLVQEFTSLHQGTVEYRENEGGGSVFSVEFPLDNAKYQPDDFVAEQIKISGDKPEADVYQISDFFDDNHSDVLLEIVPIVPVAGKKYKILIIDDNDSIREFLDSKLNPYFEIITAPDGTIGIHKSIHDDPDLIICDVMMPGMNGFELTKKLKDDFETCHIPVILLTAYTSDEFHSEGVEAGADAYVTKPFSMKFLMLQINKLLEKREKLHKHYATGSRLLPDESKDYTDSNIQEGEEAFAEEKPLLLQKDNHFLHQVEEILEKNLTDPEFTVDEFAKMMNTGRTLFFKKIKYLTGYSPNEFVRMRRMQKAAELLKTYKYNVSEVSYMVGINDPFYFSKCFKAQYGCSPSKYLNS